MIKYFCDKCEREVNLHDLSDALVDGKNMRLCTKCYKKLTLMRKEVDRRFLKGEELEFTPPKEPQHMIVTGYCNHDCESWYRCPECGKEYGSWGFFHNHMLPGTVFECDDCKTKLIVPE